MRLILDNKENTQIIKNSTKNYPFKSYSYSHILCAFAGDNQPIGIDIEPVGRFIDPSFSNQFVHPQEKIEDLLAHWTKKEAIFKVLSTLEEKNIPFNQIRVENNLFYYKQIKGSIQTNVLKDHIVSVAKILTY